MHLARSLIGGITITPASARPEGFQTTLPGLNLISYEDQQPGFLRISVGLNKKGLTNEYFTVPFDRSVTQLTDTVSVSW